MSWHKESWRHSLASKGVKTAKFRNSYGVKSRLLDKYLEDTQGYVLTPEQAQVLHDLKSQEINRKYNEFHYAKQPHEQFQDVVKDKLSQDTGEDRQPIPMNDAELNSMLDEMIRNAERMTPEQAAERAKLESTMLKSMHPTEANDELHKQFEMMRQLKPEHIPKMMRYGAIMGDKLNEYHRKKAGEIMSLGERRGKMMRGLTESLKKTEEVQLE